MAMEVLAQGLTGTAVAGLGYQLANMGWIRAERSTSRNAEALMQEAGDQPYSFITPIGSYTFDWAQPIAVPLFMGVALYESLMRQDKIDPDTVASPSPLVVTLFSTVHVAELNSYWRGFGT